MQQVTGNADDTMWSRTQYLDVNSYEQSWILMHKNVIVIGMRIFQPTKALQADRNWLVISTGLDSIYGDEGLCSSLMKFGDGHHTTRRLVTLKTHFPSQEWSTSEAFALYYQGFLEWDLGLGPNATWTKTDI